MLVINTRNRSTALDQGYSPNVINSAGETDGVFMTEPLPSYTNAILRLRRTVAADTVYVYDTAPDGYYLTDTGWEDASGETLLVDTIYDQSGKERHARQYTESEQVELKFDNLGAYFDLTGEGTYSGEGQSMVCDSFFSGASTFFRIEDTDGGSLNGIIAQFRNVNPEGEGKPYIHVGKDTDYLVSMDGSIGDRGSLLSSGEPSGSESNAGSTWDGVGHRDISIVMDTQKNPMYDMLFALNTLQEEEGSNYHCNGKVRYIISYSDTLEVGGRTLVHNYLKWRYSSNWLATDKPTVIGRNNPSRLYALKPFEGYWGPVALVRRVVKNDEVYIYDTRSDGRYLTDAGWEHGVGETLYLKTWVDQGLLGNNAVQDVDADQPLVVFRLDRWVVQPNGAGEPGSTAGGFMRMPTVVTTMLFTKVANIGLGGSFTVHTIVGNETDTSEYMYFSKVTGEYITIAGTTTNEGYVYRNNDPVLGLGNHLGTNEDIEEPQVVSIGMTSLIGGEHNLLFTRLEAGDLTTRPNVEVECLIIYTQELAELTTRKEIHDELMLKYGV